MAAEMNMLIELGYGIVELFDKLVHGIANIPDKLAYLCLLGSYKLDPDQTIADLNSTSSLQRVLRKYGDFSVKEE